jgi:hypothetical protein
MTQFIFPEPPWQPEDDGSGKGGGGKGRVMGQPVVLASEHVRQLTGADEAMHGS